MSPSGRGEHPRAATLGSPQPAAPGDGIGYLDIPGGGRARANGLPVQGAATPLGSMPSKEPQRRNVGPVARALRGASKRPRYGVALLAKGAGHWRRRAPCSGTVWTQRDPPTGLSTDPRTVPPPPIPLP